MFTLLSAPIKTPILAPKAVKETYAIAVFIKRIAAWLLGLVHLENNETALAVVYTVLVLAIAIVVGLLTRWVVLFIVRRISKHYAGDLYESLSQNGFFTKLCRIVTPLILISVIPFTFNEMHRTGTILMRVTLVYGLYAFAVASCAFINSVWHHVDITRNTRKLPLQGIAQVIKGFVWILFVVFAIAVIIDRSPAKLVAGVGAFAAVLMLVFKDPILGVVSGVQLSDNDSLHVGDWISVKGTDANGTVEDVTLTMVKVVNFDKTVTTVPPYSLISNGFTNYRNMQLSNTRRISNSWNIDADTIRVLSSEEIENLRTSDPLVAKVLDDAKTNPSKYPGVLDSNLGLMRYTLAEWLKASPFISQNDMIMVRLMPQTPNGVPMQVYCFTNTSVWLEFEYIMSSVFEHIAVTLSEFDLYVFESESGRDTVVEGWMSSPRDPRGVRGVPYPFFSRPNEGSILTDKQAANVASDSSTTSEK